MQDESALSGPHLLRRYEIGLATGESQASAAIGQSNKGNTDLHT
jgi:hypothetical protein